MFVCIVDSKNRKAEFICLWGNGCKMWKLFGTDAMLWVDIQGIFSAQVLNKIIKMSKFYPKILQIS